MKFSAVPFFALVLVGFSPAFANDCTSAKLKLVTPKSGSNVEMDGVVSPVTGRVVSINVSDLGSIAKIEEAGSLAEVKIVEVVALDFSVAVGAEVKKGQQIGRHVSIRPNLIARSTHPDLGVVTVSRLEGANKDKSLLERVLMTYGKRFDATRESDREFVSFGLETALSKPENSVLRQYEFNKTIVEKFGSCVEAVGVQQRRFSGSQFAVVEMDSRRYLVERAWTE